MTENTNLSCTPPELRAMAEKATEGLIPTKSNKAYKKQFDIFSTWCEHNNVKLITENVLMAYFHTISDKKSSTLWTTYSILRTMINIRYNIDISKYLRLQGQLKRHSEKYEPKNTNMMTKDIEYKADSILVSVPKTKTNMPRLFAITDSNWVNLVKHYANLRPKCTHHERFFINYRNGGCNRQPIGINKIGQMPKVIATFLKLQNPELFSGHCFRRSSASHLANAGGDLLTIKRHGGWKSSAVAEGYVEASLKRKMEIAQMLAPGDSQASTSTATVLPTSVAPTTSNATVVIKPQVSMVNVPETTTATNSTTNVKTYEMPNININSGSNCNITVNIYNQTSGRN